MVQTAVEMADKLGDSRAVSLAAVARALNVRTPSLYNHVNGADDLQYGMALYATRQLIDRIQEASGGLVGREALTATATAYRQFAQQHPGIYPLVAKAPDAEQAELARLAGTLLQFLLLILASLGLEGENALHAVRGLRAILHGFVSLEAADGFKFELDREESFRRLVRTYIEGLAEKS